MEANVLKVTREYIILSSLIKKHLIVVEWDLNREVAIP